MYFCGIKLYDMPGGRPALYNRELAIRICDLIATSSKGLRSILEQNEDLPSLTTIFNWLSDPNNKEFLELYTRAREVQAEYLADEIISISDDGSNDTMQTEFGEKENKEWTSRSKLRVEARKWVAAKLKPKKFGDKLDVTSDHKPLNTIDLSGLTYEQLKELANSKPDQNTSKD